MATDQIRLDDLLARDVAVQWFEGIALVRAVCSQTLARNADGTLFPAISGITLGSDGTVAIALSAATRPVAAAGHLLALTLGEDAPVRLRLLVTQATAANAGSLQEFSDSLAYFERPNSEAILRSLHARALVAAPLAARPVVPELTVVESTPTPPAPARASRRRRRWGLVTAAIVLVAAAGVLVRAGSRDGRVAAAIAGLKDSIAAAIETTEETGENAAATAEQAPAKHPAASRPQESSGRARGVASASEPGIQIASALGAAIPDMLPDPDLSAALVPLEAALPPPSQPITGAAEDRSQIYSRVDPSVIPARQVYPVLPAMPTPGIRVEDLTVLDLVISPEGAVEQVRMRTTPRNVREFMLVSAAKAWRFQPATLDGRPVRFQHSVAITN